MQPRYDVTNEDRYWQDEFASRPYVPEGASYDDYGPAYRYGAETFPKHRDRTWDDIEADLERDWDSAKGASRLAWNDARLAARDSFERVRDAFDRDPAGIPGP